MSRKAIAGALICASICAAAFWTAEIHHKRGQPDSQALTVRVADVRAIASSPRKIYPLSVIPAGVYSAGELASARRIDAVVRAHYSEFGLNPDLRSLTRDTYLYISYRKGDRVYWTANKHRLAKGELVLSDGNHLARARCGNRLSVTAQGPTLPGKQPSEAMLDTPELPQPLELPKPALFVAQSEAPTLPFAPPAGVPMGVPALLPLGNGAPMGGFFAPAIGAAGGPYMRPIANTGTPTTGGPGGRVPAGPPVAPVPEPASLGLLLAAGVASAALIRKQR